MLNLKTRRQIAGLGKSALALVMAGVVLLVAAMAVSPELHHKIHGDSDAPNHQCAATMFAHGLVDSASADLPVVAPLPLIQTVSPVEISFFSPAIENLPAGRAPPVSSSNS